MADPTPLFFAFLAMLEQARQGQQQPAAPPQGPPGPPGPPAPVPAAFPLPAPALPLPPGAGPPMPPWPTSAPSTLPPFPGPGWVYDLPVTPAISSRAQYWNPLLWDYPTKTIRKPYVQEQLGGQWVTFNAVWHPGDKGPHTYMSTEAWRLASALPAALPAPAPGAAPALPIPPPVAPGLPLPIPTAPAALPPPVLPVSVPPGLTPMMLPPGPVGPEPALGAWKTNAAYIRRYQTSLTYLSQVLGQPAWNPKGIDGSYGTKTHDAVVAFQTDNRLSPVDGQVGNVTSGAIDKLVAARGAGPPIPVLPTIPAPGQPIPVSIAIPSPVNPYPGPGAWQTNALYIRRYQTALTFLASSHNRPAWDPKGIDGKYGTNTSNAVKAFQTDNGLPVDGQAGQATANALDTLLAQAVAA